MNVPDNMKMWGTPGVDFDVKTMEQLIEACNLPITVAGALMPDGHYGYGLPIGGVVGLDNAVMPFGVGMDIACRMRLSVLDFPLELLESHWEDLAKVLEKETRFGKGANFADGEQRQHDVMDMDWDVSPVTAEHKDRAYSQLGSSGGGNHFVEFGVVDDYESGNKFVGLLSHSGSRGVGARTCEYYSDRAKEANLAGTGGHLSWLSMDSAEGQEYWAAMNLMGEYAHANHECIHDAITENLGCGVAWKIENHHNFAWKETHEVDGVERELYVHRKGATPAGKGVVGVIPGTMMHKTFLVEGLGGAGSMDSASHGAGRIMSRTQAKKKFNWEDTDKALADANVRLLSAGLDENPYAYKSIFQVMSNQIDLVKATGTFQPSIVLMAGKRT